MIDRPDPAYMVHMADAPADPVDAYFWMVGRGGFAIPGGHQRALQRKYDRLLGSYVFGRDRFRCRYCGKDLLHSVDSLLSITRDHVFPRSRGGATSGVNLVTCCLTCNALKADHVTPTLAAARRLVARLRGEHIQRLHELREVYR